MLVFSLEYYIMTFLHNIIKEVKIMDYDVIYIGSGNAAWQGGRRS